jgi:serine-type D-Ala-D-Ala carboxypeptidase/endopeptidase (penicillin-binding protein 4)
LTKILILAASIMVFATPKSLAQASAQRAELPKNIAKLILGQRARVQTSLYFVKVSDGAVIWSYQPDLVLSPASTTKLVTAAAVLDGFSTTHKFNTKFYYTGKRVGGVIQGDLVAVGDGDPFFVSEKLWQLSADLRNLGIRQVRGNLIIDNSLFDRIERDSSRKSGVAKSRNAYDAPVSALGVNFNTVGIALAPGLEDGKKGLVAIDPYPLEHLILVNQLKTTMKNQNSYQVTRETQKDGRERIAVSGQISTRTGLKKVYRSVSDGMTNAGQIIKAFLRNENVVIKGRVKGGRLPAQAKFLFGVRSYEMKRIIAGLNQYSNNFIADVLVKRLGAAYPVSGKAEASGSGSFRNGVAAINRFLRNKVKLSSSYRIKNGSGLDPSNRLSAHHLVKILKYMESRFDIFPDFLASLPTTGSDGTLKKRFRNQRPNSVTKHLRAKTGTLTQPIAVSSLAGYVRHPDMGLVAFAIIENGIQGAPSQPAVSNLRRRQEAILHAFGEMRLQRQ